MKKENMKFDKKQKKILIVIVVILCLVLLLFLFRFLLKPGFLERGNVGNTQKLSGVRIDSGNLELNKHSVETQECYTDAISTDSICVNNAEFSYYDKSRGKINMTIFRQVLTQNESSEYPEILNGVLKITFGRREEEYVMVEGENLPVYRFEGFRSILVPYDNLRIGQENAIFVEQGYDGFDYSSDSNINYFEVSLASASERSTIYNSNKPEDFSSVKIS